MMVKKMQESDTENEIREAYRVFDKERTGCIAVSEMRLILSNLPEKLSEVRTLSRLYYADHLGLFKFFHFSRRRSRRCSPQLTRTATGPSATRNSG